MFFKIFSIYHQSWNLYLSKKKRRNVLRALCAYFVYALYLGKYKYKNVFRDRNSSSTLAIIYAVGCDINDLITGLV